MVISPFAPQDFRVFELPRFADYSRAAREAFGPLRDCIRLR